MKLLQYFTNLRKRYFLTRAEHEALLEIAITDVTLQHYEPAQHAAAEARTHMLRAVNLWQSLQRMNVGVDRRRQTIEVKMLLDRGSLHLLDVTDAAKLLASRTEKLYLQRLKEITAANRPAQEQAP